MLTRLRPTKQMVNDTTLYRAVGHDITKGFVKSLKPKIHSSVALHVAP
jgi:hypothetical protein